MNRISTWLLAAMALIPVAGIALPLANLLWHGATGVHASSQLPAQNSLWISLRTSTIAAVATTVLSTLFGLPTAFMLVHSRAWVRRLVNAVLMLPILLPPIVGGVSTLVSYGPYTVLGAWFDAHGLPLTDSIIGIILAQSFITSPFLILSAEAGFASIPRELDEVAKLFGGGVWTRLCRVSIPLSQTAILTGMCLTFARAIGEFGATLLMAYHPTTVPIHIWIQFQSNGMNGIVPAAAVLVVLSIAFALLVSLVSKRRSRI